MSTQEAAAVLTLEQAIAQVSLVIQPRDCKCGACFACAWVRVQEFIETMQQSALCCPNCDSFLVSTIGNAEMTFLYGETELTCIHSVRTCLSCRNPDWTDMETEYAQAEAVIQHLQRGTAEGNDEGDREGSD